MFRSSRGCSADASRSSDLTAWPSAIWIKQVIADQSICPLPAFKNALLLKAMTDRIYGLLNSVRAVDRFRKLLIAETRMHLQKIEIRSVRVLIFLTNRSLSLAGSGRR